MSSLQARKRQNSLEPYGFLILVALLYTSWVGSIINPIISMVARALL